MTITEIAARIAIAEVKARYCLCLDTKDWAGYADCFTEDLEMDVRPSGGALTTSRDEALALVRPSIETAITCHHVHSPIMTFNPDGSADVIWAMQDRVSWGSDRHIESSLTGITGFGHYHEHYVQGSDGQWRIAKLKLTRLHIDKHYESDVAEAAAVE